MTYTNASDLPPAPPARLYADRRILNERNLSDARDWEPRPSAGRRSSGERFAVPPSVPHATPPPLL